MTRSRAPSGWNASTIIFRCDAEIFPPDLAAQFAANDSEALVAGKGIEVEEIALYKDGELHTSIVHKFPMFDRHGEVIALGGVVTDITERKRLEEELQAEQRAASRGRSERRWHFGGARSISSALPRKIP